MVLGKYVVHIFMILYDLLIKASFRRSSKMRVVMFWRRWQPRCLDR